MSRTRHIISFPPELLVEILKELGHGDLIACSKSCKHFHELVNHTDQLVYKIELRIDGYADGPPSVVSTGERLALLRDMRSRWRSLASLKQETVQLPGLREQCEELHYAQGVFAQIIRHTQGDRVKCSVTGTMLPTRTSQAKDFGIIIDDYEPQPHRSFAVDYSLDLVVIAEAEPEPDLEEIGFALLTLHLRSISSNGKLPHPACQQPLLLQELEGCDDGDIICQPKVAGDALGVLLDIRGLPHLAIWNWLTGERLVYIHDLNLPFFINDFVFLSPRTFIAATLAHGKSQDCPELVVFSFDRTGSGIPYNSILVDGAVDHVMTLCLPTVNGAGWLGQGSLCITAGWPSSVIPFKAGEAPRILVYDLMNAGFDFGREDLRIVVHSDVLSYVTKSCSLGTTHESRRIPWEVWGPKYTRMFSVSSLGWTPNPQQRYVPVHGERLISTFPGANERITQLMDFNPRRLSTEINDSGNPSMIFSQPSTISVPAFADPVTTTMPYSLVRIPNAESYHDLLLDQQRFIGLKIEDANRGSKSPAELDVYVF